MKIIRSIFLLIGLQFISKIFNETTPYGIARREDSVYFVYLNVKQTGNYTYNYFNNITTIDIDYYQGFKS